MFQHCDTDNAEQGYQSRDKQPLILFHLSGTNFLLEPFPNPKFSLQSPPHSPLQLILPQNAHITSLWENLYIQDLHPSTQLSLFFFTLKLGSSSIVQGSHISVSLRNTLGSIWNAEPWILLYPRNLSHWVYYGN